MSAREPSHTGEIFVFGVLDKPLRRCRSRTLAGRNSRSKLLGFGGDISRDKDDVVLEFPLGRAFSLLIVRRDPVLHQRSLPSMSDNQWPHKEEELAGIEKNNAI